MPLDPAKLHGRLFTCGGLITVGAVCAGAIASVYQEAIPFYQQSIEIYRKIDHRSGEGGSLCHLGNSYQALGKEWLYS